MDTRMKLAALSQRDMEQLREKAEGAPPPPPPPPPPTAAGMRSRWALQRAVVTSQPWLPCLDCSA